MNKRLLFIPLVALLFTGCKGNTWNKESSSQSEEPIALDFTMTTSTIYEGRFIYLDLIGGTTKNTRFEHEGQTLIVFQTISETRVKATATGEYGGNNIIRAIKNNSEVVEKRLRVYGQNPFNDQFYRTYSYLMDNNVYDFDNNLITTASISFRDAQIESGDSLDLYFELNNKTYKYFLTYAFEPTYSMDFAPIDDLDLPRLSMTYHPKDEEMTRAYFDVNFMPGRTVHIGE